MKRMVTLFFVFICLNFLFHRAALAVPLTQAGAYVTGGAGPIATDFTPPIENSLAEDTNGTSRIARARALTTGSLGTFAWSNSTSNTSNYSSGGADIQDTLFLNLSNAVPTADGMAILMHVQGTLSLNATNPQYAEARFHISIEETWNAVPNTRCAGVLVLRKDLPGQPAYLSAPILNTYNYYGQDLDNLFLHPKNSPFFPVNQSGNSFSFFGPLYLILDGVTPSFLNGKEIRIKTLALVTNGAGEANFENTVTFDSVRPFWLYSSSSQETIYLPPGSTYNSTAGLGIPATPTETTPNPPTPNPMTWAVEPFAASPTSISMTSAKASHTECSPIHYNSEFMDSPTGGSGGLNFDWQESAVFTNTGLQPNHQYGYRVSAGACAPSIQDTVESNTVYAYTLAQDPTPAPFTNKSRTGLRANWNGGGNPAWTEYYCENITKGTDSGWITNTFWDSIGLTPGVSYQFRVKAKNGDGFETAFVDLGSEQTSLTSFLYLPLIIK